MREFVEHLRNPAACTNRVRSRVRNAGTTWARQQLEAGSSSALTGGVHGS